MRLSERSKEEMWRRRSRGIRLYEIARQARLNPTVLSAMLHNAIPISTDDQRVHRLAAVLGLRVEECLAADESAADEMQRAG